MEGRYGLYRQRSSGWTSWRNEEFQEEDVWAVVNERGDFTNNKYGLPESATNTPRRLSSAARLIPRGTNNTAQEHQIVQQSAPVNIPDWSKIYGKNSKKGSWFDDDGDGHGEGGNDDFDDEDEDGNMMPPHEWIARKDARSQMSSFSVCEGIGRTLKGRDLSRVRNAVLTKTGFLE